MSNHFVNVDSECLVNKHAFFFEGSKTLHFVVASCNLCFPALKQSSERVVDSILDLLAQHFKVEEDLDALHKTALVSVLECLMELGDCLLV